MLGLLRQAHRAEVPAVTQASLSFDHTNAAEALDAIIALAQGISRRAEVWAVAPMAVLEAQAIAEWATELRGAAQETA
jgi:hypothetical protein